MTTYDIDPERSTVRIAGSSSVHPIHAEATGLTGSIEVTVGGRGLGTKATMTGDVRIDVGRLSSGNGLVDRETRRRIDAKRFPEITGTITSSTRVSADRMSLVGDLFFRGETVEVSGEVSVAIEDGELLIDGSQTFDVRDWGLQPPKVALLKVHPEIDVDIRLVATPQ